VVEDVFVRHSSGVRALLAPENLAGMESVIPDRIIGAIEQLRDHFDYVVIDLWSSLDELTTSVLTVADRILLVTTPELPALRDLSRALAAMGPLHLDTKGLVVLNRYPASAGFSKADVESALARPVGATIPSEGIAVTQSINEGRPLMSSRGAKGVKSYRELADAMTKDAAGPARRPSGMRSTPAVQAR
jgi:pilus assembly protein CpaE